MFLCFATAIRDCAVAMLYTLLNLSRTKHDDQSSFGRLKCEFNFIFINRIKAKQFWSLCVCLYVTSFPPSLFHTLFYPLLPALCCTCRLPTQNGQVEMDAGQEEDWTLNTVRTNFIILSCLHRWQGSHFQTVSSLHHTSTRAWSRPLLKCNLLRITEHPLEIWTSNIILCIDLT